MSPHFAPRYLLVGMIHSRDPHSRPIAGQVSRAGEQAGQARAGQAGAGQAGRAGVGQVPPVFKVAGML